MRDRKAFTLIELLVVIGVLVILAGLLLPMVYRARRQALISTQRSDIATISNALQQYKSDFGNYPGVPFQRNPATGQYYSLVGVLAKSLIGPGPYIDPTTGKTVADPSVIRSGSVPPPMIGDDGNDGPGFRTITNGKTWGPYIDVEHFKVRQERVTPDPTDPDPWSEYGADILDQWGNPILYFPRINIKTVDPNTNLLLPLVYAPNPMFNPPLPLLPPGPTPQFDYRSVPGKNPALAVEGVGSSLNLPIAPVPVFQVLLGDLDQDNTIDPSKSETLRCSEPYVLWSAGQNGIFGDNFTNSTPSANDHAVGAWDDIYNFQR